MTDHDDYDDLTNDDYRLSRTDLMLMVTGLVRHAHHGDRAAFNAIVRGARQREDLERLCWNLALFCQEFIARPVPGSVDEVLDRWQASIADRADDLDVDPE